MCYLIGKAQNIRTSHMFNSYVLIAYYFVVGFAFSGGNVVMVEGEKPGSRKLTFWWETNNYMI